jgi:GTPase Era involved in 16S rRNA processing
MDKHTETLIYLDSEELTKSELVSYLTIVVSRLEIDTLSEMARRENKCRTGIIVSDCYKKIKIGKQTLAIKGVRQDNMPF